MRFIKGASAVIVILALVMAAGYGYWRHVLNAPLALNKPQIYEVHQGDGARATLLRLQSEGIISSRWPYVLEVMLNRHWLGALKVGEFRIEPNMNAFDLIRRLSSNDVVTYTITIPEGRNFAAMRAEVNHANALKHDTADMDDSALMSAIGHPGEQPEGRFFPSTYRYTRGTSDKVIYRRAYDLMQRELSRVWQNRATDLPYDTPYKALIMASLVEQEAASADERPQIAGVFVRRLKKGMRLQTDPSVVYGLDLANGRELTRKDLATDNPYNTYRNNGLPPTPISLPGRASLEAAVHPDNGDSLYFVAMGNGHHVFSTTLKEHDAAVKRYVVERARLDQQQLTHAIGIGQWVLMSAAIGAECETPVATPNDLACPSLQVALNALAQASAMQLMGTGMAADGAAVDTVSDSAPLADAAGRGISATAISAAQQIASNASNEAAADAQASAPVTATLDETAVHAARQLWPGQQQKIPDQLSDAAIRSADTVSHAAMHEKVSTASHHPLAQRTPRISAQDSHGAADTPVGHVRASTANGPDRARQQHPSRRENPHER